MGFRFWRSEPKKRGPASVSLHAAIADCKTASQAPATPPRPTAAAPSFATAFSPSAAAAPSAVAVPSADAAASTNAAASSAAPVDLLGRPVVNLDTPQLQRFLAGKRVLVTGAGGSIGSEICRQTMKFCPARLVLLDRCENALFEIDRELRERWLGADIHPCIADIDDPRRIDTIFAGERPQVIFHAAAHKHVPMMELHPGEAIKNNVLGTKTVADAAVACGAMAFVLISTDKAVNPTSVMGAAKRCAELYVQALNNPGELAAATAAPVWAGSDSRAAGGPGVKGTSPGGTRFVVVRFGNVLNSSGSVVPIFERQIAAGGPVTVTHADMYRFFMTIPEASQLVMQAGAIGRGGEIFVLDMGQPVRILDLAQEMIRRAGLVVGRDIDLKIVGVRPGEKLVEELDNASDTVLPTSHPRISVWQLPRQTRQQTGRMIADLAKAAGVLGMDVSMDVDVDVHRANASDHRVAVAGRLAAAVGPPPGVVDSNANAVSALRRWVPEYAPTGANAELIGGVSESFETQFLEDFDTSAADASRLHVRLEAVPPPEAVLQPVLESNLGLRLKLSRRDRMPETEAA